jgi:hypothetical protein
LLATLLQQWARRYIKNTQPRYSPHKRGRIRAFYAEGVANLHLPRVVEALPTLLHLSLFLFFAGLLVFLFSSNVTVFSAVAWWVAFCIAAYISITFMPLFRPDSPYYAPLSSSAWFLATGVLTLLFQVLCWLEWTECFSYNTWQHFNERKKHYREWLVRGRSKTTEAVARKLPSAIDGRALMWTLECSDEDQELERFFASIPGFCNSKVLVDPIRTCIIPNMERMTEALIGFMHRTLTSNLVAQKTKIQRLIICREAMRAASLRTSPQIFRRIIDGEWDGLLRSVEFGLFLGDADDSDPVTAYHSQTILSIILPRVQEQERDDRWFRLVTHHLGFSRRDLGNYLANGDSMSLATSIRIIRKIVYDHLDSFWLGDAKGDAATRWKLLELVSEFDIRETLPTLQHDFCDLWNEIVNLTKNSPDPRVRSVSIAILKNVRNAYITLHQGTDSAPTVFSSSTPDDFHALILSSSYPLCNVSDHHPHPASHIDHPSFNPGIPSFPIPHPDYGSSLPAQLVPPLTLTATTTSGNAPAFYVNITAPVPLDPPAFPIPVPDNTMNPFLSAADPAVSRSDHTPFVPETDSSTLSPVAPRWPIPVLDRGATVGEGSARVALRNDHATGPPLADPVTAPHNSVRPPPPPPPQRSSADIAIPSPSRSPRDAEERGNLPPRPLHGEPTSET